MKIEKSSNISKKPVNVEGAKDVDIRWLISKADGAENFEMRMFELQPGGFTPLHTHPHEHEVFVVEGQGVFVYEGKEYPFKMISRYLCPAGKSTALKIQGIRS